MTVEDIMKKMILISNGNTHDINHFLKVYAYSTLIGRQENIDQHKQQTLEIAAILHDIACPLCREKYGNTNGKKQESEGMLLVRNFFAEMDIDSNILERVIYLVGHHHTHLMVDDIDYQILLEADYLVNADESNYSSDNIRSTMEKIFKTKTGKELLQSIYLGV